MSNVNAKKRLTASNGQSHLKKTGSKKERETLFKSDSVEKAGLSDHEEHIPKRIRSGLERKTRIDYPVDTPSLLAEERDESAFADAANSEQNSGDFVNAGAPEANGVAEALVDSCATEVAVLCADGDATNPQNSFVKDCSAIKSNGRSESDTVLRNAEQISDESGETTFQNYTEPKKTAENVGKEVDRGKEKPVETHTAQQRKVFCCLNHDAPTALKPASVIIAKSKSEARVLLDKELEKRGLNTFSSRAYDLAEIELDISKVYLLSMSRILQ